MKVIVDTNVLLRWLLQDTSQSQVLEELLASTSVRIILVPTLVFAEIAWVLSSHYLLSRSEISEGLKLLMRESRFECDRNLITISLEYFVAHGKVSFVDCMLLAEARCKKILSIISLDADLQKVWKKVMDSN